MVSIIIVNYKVEKELIACISSVIKSKTKVKFEIIVVDNSQRNDLERKLKNFPQVKYIKSERNIGFGAGNNLGSKVALGEYLFFLNPDTVIEKCSIDILYDFANNNPKTGMIAPLLLDVSGKPYSNQGSNKYEFKSAMVIGSFLNNILPNNPISKEFFHKDWNKKNVEEFDVVPGTAFMIKKDLFEKIGRFDENFFLYFEEYDLAKRVKELRYRNYVVPQAKAMHVWEASAKKRNDIGKIFAQSRDYFFRKNYGKLFAFLVKLFSNIGKKELLLGFILILSVSLSSFKIRELMPFIGDQAWFYLSARDAISTGQIPLVGIASSHPWLHQGPLWTYLLIPFLWIFNFDPVSGAYLTITLGVLSVMAIYVVGSMLFSKRAGLIASLLYATSPLAVYYMRFPYHTSPMPLFVIILIFPLYKIIKEELSYVPLAIFLLAILYNFEIATSVLWGIPVLLLIYCYSRNRKSLIKFLNKKNIFFSILSLIVPLVPIILYDVKNGFPQTLKFAAWIFYRAISLFSYNSHQSFSIDKIFIMFNFLFDNFTKLIFAQNSFVFFIIMSCLIVWMTYELLRKRMGNSNNLLILLLLIPLLLVALNQIPSDAYLPIFFPVLILLFSSFLDFVIMKKYLFFPVLILIIVLTLSNVHFMLKNNFMFDKSGRFFTLDKQLQATAQILKIAQKRDYNLKGKGSGSQFESFTMNYEYLSWWLGRAPSKKNEHLKIYISKSASGIKIESKSEK
jgi:hypothetical protein